MSNANPTSLLRNLAFAAIALAASGATGEEHHRGPVVETSDGRVRGVSSSGIDRFLGIPYEAPPGGARGGARRSHTADGGACATPRPLRTTVRRLPRRSVCPALPRTACTSTSLGPRAMAKTTARRTTEAIRAARDGAQ